MDTLDTAQRLTGLVIADNPDKAGGRILVAILRPCQ